MSPPTLDAALRRNARERPSAIACVLVPNAREKNRKCFFTWDELHGVVDALARVLRADRHPRVLSFCRDGVEAFVALHACARARKSLVNVDAATPASRIRDVARDANATTCLCANDGDEDSVKSVLGEDGVAVRVWEVINAGAEAIEAEEDETREDDEIWIAYTSGTTGKCKGAAATHRRAMAYARAKCEVEEIDACSRVCLASNATFDLWHGDACAAAAAGAAVVVASRATFQHDFARVLREGEVTHVCCTPTMFSLARLPRGIVDAPKLRCVSLAGERMRESTIALWADDVALYNVYGATETTVVQTYARMRNAEDESTNRAGKAYEGFASVFVVDEMREGELAVQSFAQRRGVEGEVAIGGICVADGYLNDPERTARAFVHSPFGTVYLTGDRGYIDDAGDLYLRGRLDRQVKIRGHRVELDEIEAALRSCPALCDDAVVFYDANEGVLTSHARAASPTFDASSDADLYAFALERVVELRLPRHMVPRRHVFIEHARWPLTSSGKTNRQILLQWFASGETKAFRPKREKPQAGLETVVANAWAVALGHGDASDIGALDAFDALGGTSLNVLAVSKALASDDGIVRSRDTARGEIVRDARIGLRDGEAAALLNDGEEPAACAFDVIDGPFAPCEIFARPVLRDYVDYLRAQGIDADVNAPASTAVEPQRDTSANRRMLAACGRGVAPVVRALLATGVEASGEHLRAAAASLADEAVDVVQTLLAAGADASSSSATAGTLATHVAAARGNSEMLEMLLAAGAPAGAKDADKQTICHLAVRSGDVSTVRVAANACKHLKTRKGGLESWDRWKRTPAAWALVAGSSEILAELRDAGANLTSLETDVSNAWVHGSLSAKSEVQLAHRPVRKRGAAAEVLSALAARLDAANVESERIEAATAIRELVCANAENREKARTIGLVPKLCELARDRHCVEAIGALRNLATNRSAAGAAGDAGAMEILGNVIRARAKVKDSELSAEDRRIVYAAASAMRALAVKHDANAARLRASRDVADVVSRLCEGMRLE